MRTQSIHQPETSKRKVGTIARINSDVNKLHPGNEEVRQKTKVGLQSFVGQEQRDIDPHKAASRLLVHLAGAAALKSLRQESFPDLLRSAGC